MIEVKGHWQPGCEPLVDAFAANFAEAGEEGAALSVFHRGDLLVDIFAGSFHNKQAGLDNQSWKADTRVNIFSAGKPLVAATVLQLIADNRLTLDTPIADIWPEFAQMGKEHITVRQVLCHRSGISALHDRCPDAAIFDWADITGRIAAETPWFDVDAAQGYSPFIYGWILGEVVRRVTGAESFNQVFQQTVAEPLSISAAFGIADDEQSALADTSALKHPASAPVSTGQRTEGADSAALGRLMKSDPRGITNRAFANPMSLMTSTNSSAWRAAQVPAANAQASARDLAAFYSGLIDGKVLDASVLPLCWQEQSSDTDRVLGVPLRFASGFMLTQADRADCRFGRGERAFGHPGAGGALGFADPDYQVGFGYVTARLGQNVLIDDRAIRLIDALYNLPEIGA